MPFFKQETLEKSDTRGGLDSTEYTDALKKLLTSRTIIDDLIRQNQLDAICGTTNGVACCIDLISGDYRTGPGFSGPAAMAGYPHITVPMGSVMELAGWHLVCRPRVYGATTAGDRLFIRAGFEEETCTGICQRADEERLMQYVQPFDLPVRLFQKVADHRVELVLFIDCDRMAGVRHDPKIRLWDMLGDQP